MLGWDTNGRYVLFAGAFDNAVKNSLLAKEALSLINDVHLVEMRGFTREQVNLVMNAANCLLMTSHREGSPQVVKEAMVCGTPIVSVDVAHNVERAFAFHGKTTGHQRIVERGLSNELIAKRIIDIYNIVLKRNRR